jgi:hypothetical protein
MKRSDTVLSFCLALLAATAVVYGCSDDGSDGAATPTTPDGGSSSGSSGASGTSGSSGSSSGDSGPSTPAPPTLGAQIDRFGRPGINTLTTKTFADDATRGAAEDAYNANASPASWVAAHKADIAQSLAFIDGFDGTCGNQLLADKAVVGPARYDKLASVLADDRVWLDTSQTACTQYLGVELSATGAAPGLKDCGGRALTYDVIDVTYSELALGATTGAPDGIAKVAAKTDGTTFPYLEAP